MKNKLSTLGVMAGVLVLMSTECKKNKTVGAIPLDCSYSSSFTLKNHNVNGADYTCDCEVDISGGTFTIEPGVEIIFNSGGALYVHNDATLKAIGTDADPIAMYESAGSWMGIYVDSEKDANEISHVKMENAGQYNFTTSVAGFSHDNKAAVVVSGKLKMTNSVIAGSKGYGVAYLSSSESMGFANNTINNSAGYPLFIGAEDLNSTSLNTCNFSANAKNFVAIYGINSNSDVSKAVDIIKAPIPYLAISSLNFRHETTMAAGAEVIMTNNAGIFVSGQGYLKINGTSSSPVIIKGETETPGFWIGLGINTNNPNNEFNYLKIYDGGSDEIGIGAELTNMAMGMATQAQLILNNCTSERTVGTCQVFVGDINGFTNNSASIVDVCTP